MQAADDQEKHLPPSQRRLEQAREEGQVARSRELVSFLLLAVGAGTIVAGGAHAAGELGGLMREALVFDAADAFDPARALARLVAATAAALLLVAPLLLVTAATAVLASIAVGGWLWSGKAMAFDWNRISPLTGLKNIFSVQGGAELGKAILKAVLIATVAWLLIVAWQGEFVGLAAMPLETAIPRAASMVALDAVILAVALGAIAVLDVPFQLWRHRRNLRMSYEEVKREQKELEGDPYLKAHIRSLQRQSARRRMMAEVPKADVVITNPSHYAVALAWREGSVAPRVVAKGADHLAARIRELALAHGVAVFEAPPLARALHRHVELDAVIPHALYAAVAQVLAYVYQLRAARAGSAPMPQPPAGIELPAGFDPAAGTRQAA